MPVKPKPTPPAELGTLVDAFAHFNEVAAQLSAAYRRLEERVEGLTHQLEDKDRELYSRVRELDRVTKFLNSLLESLPVGVVAVDMEERVTVFNRTAAEMTGFGPESVLGKPYSEVIAAQPEQSLLHTLLVGPELRGVERRLPESGRQIRVGTTWVVDSTGERVGVMEIWEDVSAIRRLEQQAEHQKVLNALGEMAAMVAHELRNPLSGIGGYAAFLKRELAADPERVQWVDKIIQSVKSLDRVAANLLLLTRQTSLNCQPVDLPKLLGEITRALSAEASSIAPAAQIELELPEESVPVTADPELLRLALLNLGRNALQALNTETGGKVALSLAWNLLGNRVAIEIRDNGCGIPPENQSRLFSPFFSTKADGTGLGLALVRKAVDLHKGEISVRSQPGAGSTFQIVLPIKPLP